MEPLSLLLDTFIKLADRIISLEKNKFQDKKELFNEIVKPLFDELEPVAQNYMSLFQNSRKIIIQCSKEDLREIARKIDEDRHAMLASRIKIREMASQISKYVKDDEIVSFANAIEDFFYRAARLSGPPSIGEELSTIINNAAKYNKEKDVALVFLDGAIESLEKSWTQIVKSYAKLKIYAISSPKLIKKS